MPSKPLKAIKPMFDKGKWRILRGDMVQIMAGRERGLVGRVLRVIRDERFPRVVVEGRNMVKRRVRQQDGPAFTVSMESPVHYSNVMVLDPITRRPVRTRWVYDADTGEKMRQTRGRHASRSVLHAPAPHKAHPGPDTRVGIKDTPRDEALRATYDPKTDFSPLVAKLPVRPPVAAAAAAAAVGGGGSGGARRYCTALAAAAAADSMCGFAAAPLLLAARRRAPVTGLQAWAHIAGSRAVSTSSSSSQNIIIISSSGGLSLLLTSLKSTALRWAGFA